MSAALCVFAKPPVAGQVKTRLARELGEDSTAELAACFFRDTWDLVDELPWAHAVLATTDSAWGSAQVGSERAWDQGSGDLGNRIERILVRALRSNERAFALGADCPGLPRQLLEAAHEALLTNEAVLGPTDDGGFYLVGLRRCPEGLFAGLPWSCPSTFRSTLDRFTSSGLTTAVLPGWFDVDRPLDLWRLERLLSAGTLEARRTKAWLCHYRALFRP